MRQRVVITGMGALSPIATGVASFRGALERGDANFSTISFYSKDRQYVYPASLLSGFNLGNELHSLLPEGEIRSKALRLRHISKSVSHAVYVALEAFFDSGLGNVREDSYRKALVCAGSNFQQGYLVNVVESYRDRLSFVNPAHGFTFLDTDIVGLLSELMEIRGEGYCVGGASASGAVALINGHRLIASGVYDTVMVVAPSMELSPYELQALSSLGAMAQMLPDIDVSYLSKPFDKTHCGFVFGENAAAIVLESETHARARGAVIKGRMTGYGSALDANRQPSPDASGELRAMMNAMAMSGITASDIEYVNTHGTGSVLGDKVEVEALLAAGFTGVKANATKSLTGHGISSAGLLEAIACLIQMDGDFIHASRNLDDPITDSIDWVRSTSMKNQTGRALSNSFGFGGINTSIVLERSEEY